MKEALQRTKDIEALQRLLPKAQMNYDLWQKIQEVVRVPGWVYVERLIENMIGDMAEHEETLENNDRIQRSIGGRAALRAFMEEARKAEDTEPFRLRVVGLQNKLSSLLSGKRGA